MSSRRLEVVAADFVAAASAALIAPDPVQQPAELPAGILQQLADAAFERSDWQEAWSYYAAAIRSGDAVVDIARCLMFGGRCTLYLGDHGTARALLETYVENFPVDAEGLFYLGRAYQAAHRDFDALNCFNAASLLQSGRPKYLAAVAQAAHSLAFQGFGFTAESMPGSYVAIAKAALAAALAKDPDHLDSLTESILLALDSGDIAGALATARKVVEKKQKHGADKVGGVVTNLALALSHGGHFDAIAGIEYLKSYPAGRRILARAKSLKAGPAPVPAEEAASAGAPIKSLAADPHGGRWTVELLGTGKLAWPKQRETVSSPAESVSVDCALVLPVRRAGRSELTGMATRLAGLPRHFAGLASFVPKAAPGTRRPADIANLLIRKPAWNELVTRNPSASWDELVALALAQLRLWVLPQAAALAADWASAPDRRSATRPRVVVLSRHGPRLVGGGEQFLRIAGETYAREQGADVLFAGLTREWPEVTPAWPDASEQHFSSGFLFDDRDALREFCLANAVEAVHVISGLGEFVLDALRGLDIRLIYGVHFWREFIAADVLSRPFYPNVTLDKVRPIAEMEQIVTRAEFTYVNSDFCADIARKSYSWSPPIIYSVPVDEARPVDSPPLTLDVRDFVLLANCRADKGWYLLLDIAALLPDQQFIAVAGQSDRDAALADVRRRDLYNVQVIERTDRIDELYRAAAVVVVPSFAFVETFSRVVIEAGRLQRPVLMADSGNLTYLGAGTDLVLPEDANVWAAKISALRQDPAAHAEAARQSAAIAAAHSPAGLMARLTTIPVRRDAPRILVCVGSGIGNICHTTPMVARLSRHYGVPVDVLVSGDFVGSAAAMAGSPHVGQVFESHAHVAERLYDVVLVSHSFGTLIPPFNAHRLFVSRDIAAFDPGGTIHESEFNLQFIRSALGIGYTEADSRDYFFGAVQAETPGSRSGPVRVALHAGSKGGIWASKRWPGFAALAGELATRGIEVISVGVAPEYVEGTLDKTDLSFTRMAEELTRCDAVVSNDSGIMNIANALGLPLVALFAPTNPVTRGPLKSSVRILAPDTDCAPCEAKARYKSRFANGSCRCIGLIGVKDVLAALGDLGLPLESPAAPQELAAAGR